MVACPQCAGRFTAPPSTHVAGIPSRFRLTRRKQELSGVAAVLSFLVPGLGQMCQGRVETGVCFLLACMALGGLTLAVWPLAVACVPVWLWNVVDAATH